MKSKEELKKKLTPIQYEVTQNNGTEPAFNNEYWNLKEEGLYVDIVSGNPLFTSKEKKRLPGKSSGLRQVKKSPAER